MRKFVIYTYAYTRSTGGIICLHKLCHLINQLGGTAFLHPVNIDVIEVNAVNIVEALRFAEEQRAVYADFKVANFLKDSPFNTPVTHIFDDKEYGDDWIAVYPEVTWGNPLKARNVVRWLLHNPGYHFGRINYGMNELHIRFGEHFAEYRHPGCTLSDNFLTITDYDFGLFNTDGVAAIRSGTAYFKRHSYKGPPQHDLTDSVFIHSGLDATEVARIFKTVKTFYSYDPHTAYSHLAVLCGAQSVVIPDPDRARTDSPVGGRGYGVAYGIENLDEAERTAHLLKPWLQARSDESVESVSAFMKEADEFFG